MEDGKRISFDRGIEILQEVRELCKELPQVEEIIDGFGHVSFKVNRKSFIIMGEDEQGQLGLSFKSDLETQQLLIQQGGFVKTPYIGRHGWVSVKSSDLDLDKDGLCDLLKEAYYRAAPKRLRSK
ncbi:MmcQ/YjbR family DNA-binding protein [Ammoniphilus sp. YIM 78166]|uniref:MmcQ/YjbR family DNA-binding protein n=1 Tax=Ammoniphilus sp. YIM 78166 TaxID=1644106 RepID=UPI00106FF2A2|nr:MmcQ/YjbR family DNA-binding protein [Ammoniphilus sp. YIM 78166]